MLGDGCRGRYELGNGRLREILVEKAGEALVEERVGGGRELYGDFGIGGSTEALVGGGGAGEKKLWGFEGGERSGEGEVFVKEKVERDKAGTGVLLGYFEEVSVGGVEDECWDGGVAGCELGGERGSDAGSIEDDLLRGNGASVCEVLPGGVSVVGHVLLAGTGWGALTVAAIVEGEDVEADVVEGCEGWCKVGEGALSAGEEEDGGVGVAVAGRGWNPPSGELGSGGFIGAKVDELVRYACDGGGSG